MVGQAHLPSHGSGCRHGADRRYRCDPQGASFAPTLLSTPRSESSDRSHAHLADGSRRLHTSGSRGGKRSEEHTSELQSRFDLVCRLLLEKKKKKEKKKERHIN